MSSALRIAECRIQLLAIPMRLRFEHAAASRATADPILVKLIAQAASDGLAGFGETLAREYVTGESSAGVADDIRTLFVPRLLDFRAGSFAEALEQIEQLPTHDGARCVQGARAAVELALLDLAGRFFGRRAADLSGWLDLPPTARGPAQPPPPYSGVAVGRKPAKFRWLLRGQRCLGLRDFKLKVAVDGWEERLRWASSVLGGALRDGRATLRVDANGGWTADEASAAAPLLAAEGVTVVEQPLPPAKDHELPDLAGRTGWEIMADESLVTAADAERLLAEGGVQVFNIRIAKVGGLIPALRMAARVRAAGRDVQLGCLVGETSLLSAAGAAFLELFPWVRFAEGAFGRWLLRADVTRRVVQFGLGGRVARLRGPGLGVEVDEAALARSAAGEPVVIRL